MNFKSLLVSGLGFIAALSLTTAHAGENDLLNAFSWQDVSDVNEPVSPLASTKTLGTATVGPNLKRYSVRVENCGSEISHVKLKVSNAGLYVETAGAKFTDGSRKDHTFKRSFAEGYESPWVSLSLFGTNGRCVEQVYVQARSTDASASSKVIVLGSVK